MEETGVYFGDLQRFLIISAIIWKILNMGGGLLWRDVLNSICKWSSTSISIDITQKREIYKSQPLETPQNTVHTEIIESVHTILVKINKMTPTAPFIV